MLYDHSEYEAIHISEILFLNTSSFITIAIFISNINYITYSCNISFESFTE